MKTLIVLATLLVVIYAQSSPRPTPAKGRFEIDYEIYVKANEIAISQLEGQLEKITEEVDALGEFIVENGQAKIKIIRKIADLALFVKAGEINLAGMLRDHFYDSEDIKDKYEVFLVHFKTLGDDLMALNERVNAL